MAVDVDKLLEQLGHYGRYQMLMFFALGLVHMRGAWQVFGTIYLAGTPNFQCNASGGELSNKSWSKTNDSCRVVLGNSTHNQAAACPGSWMYGKEFGVTIVTEWDLVCDEAYLVELSITLYMVGAALGGILLMPLADHFGRKKMILAFLLIQTVIGACSALSPNYITFTAFRFFIGMTNIAVGLTSVVMMTEVFSSACRTLPSIAIQFFWAFGIMSLALFGYAVQDWRHLTLLISLPNLLFLPYCCLLPESVPWLLSKHKYSQAEQVIEKICKVNRCALPEDFGTRGEGTALSTRPATSVTDANGHVAGRGKNHGGVESNTSDLTSVSETANRSDAEPDQIESGSDVHRTLLPSASLANGRDSVVNGRDSVVNGRDSVVNGRDSVVSGRDSVVNGHHKDSLLPPAAGASGSPPAEAAEETSIFALFRSPKLTVHSFIVFYLCLVCSLGYFGISLSTPTLHGDHSLNLFFSGLMEIPAYIVCLAVSNIIGRRIPLCVFLLLCGVMNIIAYSIPTETESGQDLSQVRLGLVMVGKFAITGAYTTVYLYSAEVFPTTIRNQAVGVCSTFDSLGATAAPFIIYGAESNKQVALVMLGVLTVLGGLSVLVLPETHHRPLPQTLQEAQQLNQKHLETRE